MGLGADKGRLVRKGREKEEGGQEPCLYQVYERESPRDLDLSKGRGRGHGGDRDLVLQGTGEEWEGFLCERGDVQKVQKKQRSKRGKRGGPKGKKDDERR